MRKIILVKMGMDLYGKDTQWDIRSYRVRPTLSGDPTFCKIKTKDGNYIAGDFLFIHKNSTNNKESDYLAWDFVDYGEDSKQCERFNYLNDGVDQRLKPTLENIKKVLEDITGETVVLEWKN